jgi:hypothetical protein
MTISILALVLLTTIIGIIIHVIWWRLKRPKDDILALFLSTIALPFFLTCTICCQIKLFEWSIKSASLEDLAQLISLAIIHFFAGFYYMGCYTGAQAASPTVLILLMSNQTPRGITKIAIEKKLTDELVCGNLVEAAIHERFIIYKNKRLELGIRGRLLLKFGITARKLVGFPINPTG